jgi:protein O-mannosyl-transferase
MKWNTPFSLYAAVLALAVTVTYSNHFHNSFHFDDFHTIVNNIYVRDIGNIPLYFADGTTFSSLPANRSYRPVVSTTLAIDYRTGSGTSDTFFFHLSTFLLFLLQGLLMFFFYRKTLRVSEDGGMAGPAAFFAVAWYLLHPANAETVNYIIARSDSLSTLAVVASFLLFACSPAGRKRHLYLIPLVAGALAKPIAAVFAPLLFLYALLFEERLPLTELLQKKGRLAAAGAAGKAAPAFLFCLALLIFIKVMGPASWNPGAPPFYSYVITQPYVILHYFTTFFLPLGLSADTDWLPLGTIRDLRFVVGSSFLILLVVAAVAASRKERFRPVSFGLLWFLVTLLPTSLTPLAEVMNDHRTFLPYVGLTLAVTWLLALGVAEAKKHFASARAFRGVAGGIAVTVLAAYACGTYLRNEVWKSEESLWRDVTVKSPGNGRGFMNYGLALMAKRDFAGAERCFMKALKLTPRYVYLHTNLGILKERTGRLAEAEESFHKAIACRPDYPVGYLYYGRFLKNRGRYDEALRNLDKVLELSPGEGQARHLLMEIHYTRSDAGKLKLVAEQTLQLAPDDVKAKAYLDAAVAGKMRLQLAQEKAKAAGTPESYIDLSLCYYQAGDYEGSVQAAQEALKLKPDYGLAYNNICAACNAMNQWDRAIEAGEKATAINPEDRLARNNLAWAKSRKAATAPPGPGAR